MWPKVFDVEMEYDFKNPPLASLSFFLSSYDPTFIDNNTSKRLRASAGHSAAI